MRLDNHKASVQAVEVHSTGDTRTYSIARNSHMFRILSDGLYSNKIAAVLREVGCNAQDAHIMGGTPDRPIFVKLPTTFDRSCYIQDWGPGLSDEQLFKMYTTYGVSLKQDNEEATGAFGLGAKSPFAYTASTPESSDGFTVSSVHEGVLRVYTCFIDEEGVPNITKMFESPNTDETWTSGLKVSFAVQAKDIKAFQQEAFRVFRWFKVPPTIVGLDVPLTRPEYQYSLNSAKLIPVDTEYRGYSYSRPFHVLMGSVLYPIDAKNMPDLTRMQSSILNLGGLLDAPMGSVMMAPSREVLQYTARTIGYIKDSLDKIALEIAMSLKEVIEDNSVGRWAWAQQIYEKWNPLRSAGLNNFEEFLKLAGVNKADADKAIAAIQQQLIVMPSFVGDGDARAVGVKVWACFESTRANSVSRQEIVDGRAITNIRDKSTSVTGLPVNQKSAVVYVDCPYYYDRVKTYFAKNPEYKRILLVYAGGSAEKQKTAKEYAEKIAQCDDFRGIEIFSLAELLPSYVAPAKGSGASAAALAWADKQGKETVSVVNGADSTLEDLVNGNDEADLFYVIHDGTGYRRPYYNENGMSLSPYNSSSFFKHAVAVYQHLTGNQPVIAVVNTAGAARRLKLEANGFKPFLVDFPAFIKKTESKAVLNAVLAGHRTTSRVDKIKAQCTQYSMQYQGLFGIVCYNYVHNTRLYKLIAKSKSAGLQYMLNRVKAKIGDLQTIKTKDALTEDELANFEAVEKLVASIEHLADTISGTGLETISNSLSEDLRADENEFGHKLEFLNTASMVVPLDEDRAKSALRILEVICEAYVPSTQSVVLDEQPTVSQAVDLEL